MKKTRKISPQKIFKGTSKKTYDNLSSIKGNDNAPIMGFMDEEMTKDMKIRDRMRGMGPKIGTMIRMFSEILKSKKSIKRNPKKPKKIIDKKSLQELIAYSKKLGVIIGFAKLKKEWIFKNEAILYENAIVLSMEMDYEKMDKAPSAETQSMIMDTYNELGIVANKITSFLRKNDFEAQACHPLGGPICYPPLIAKAGMGWYGRHGIAIIPEYGPRHRIAAVLTNIENLPMTNENKHKWIEEYCETCGICIKKCPTGAIFENAKENYEEIKTHIDNKLCFQEFSTNYGCSICVKECMFNKLGYQKIKEIYEKRNKK